MILDDHWRTLNPMSRKPTNVDVPLKKKPYQAKFIYAGMETSNRVYINTDTHTHTHAYSDRQTQTMIRAELVKSYLFAHRKYHEILS